VLPNRKASTSQNSDQFTIKENKRRESRHETTFHSCCLSQQTLPHPFTLIHSTIGDLITRNGLAQSLVPVLTRESNLMVALSIPIQVHTAIGQESTIPTQNLPLVMGEAAFAVLVPFAIPDVAAELEGPCCYKRWDCENWEYGDLEEHVWGVWICQRSRSRWNLGISSSLLLDV
jgi:hypothetical protein